MLILVFDNPQMVIETLSTVYNLQSLIETQWLQNVISKGSFSLSKRPIIRHTHIYTYIKTRPPRLPVTVTVRSSTVPSDTIPTCRTFQEGKLITHTKRTVLVRSLQFVIITTFFFSKLKQFLLQLTYTQIMSFKKATVVIKSKIMVTTTLRGYGMFSLRLEIMKPLQTTKSFIWKIRQGELIIKQLTMSLFIGPLVLILSKRWFSFRFSSLKKFQTKTFLSLTLILQFGLSTISTCLSLIFQIRELLQTRPLFMTPQTTSVTSESFIGWTKRISLSYTQSISPSRKTQMLPRTVMFRISSLSPFTT